MTGRRHKRCTPRRCAESMVDAANGINKHGDYLVADDVVVGVFLSQQEIILTADFMATLRFGRILGRLP